MSTILPHMVWLSANLRCRSEACCTQLAKSTGHKNSPSGHRRSTLSCYIFATKAHIDSRKKLVRQQYLLTIWWTSTHYRLKSVRLFGAPKQIPTGFASSLHYCTAFEQSAPAKLCGIGQRVRGCHLCSAGQPSCWALAHILVTYTFCCDNLWKSIIMALENPENHEIFLLLCGHPG